MSDEITIILFLLQALILPTQYWIGRTIWNMRQDLNNSIRATAVLDKHVMDKTKTMETMLADHEARLRKLERAP